MVKPKLRLSGVARANPGKLTFGSPGAGSTPHLATEQLMKAASIRFVHVPYQGMAPAMNDLIGGHIDMMIDLYGNASPNIKEGKLRLLAVTTQTRLPQEPDVPTIAEGVPGFVHGEWFAMVAPPKTPADIASKLSAAVAETLSLPDVAMRMADFAAVPVGATPDETAAFIKVESDRWHRLIDTTGLRVIPTRWVGEQQVREDFGRIPSFADWVRAIRPERWMGRATTLGVEGDPRRGRQPEAVS